MTMPHGYFDVHRLATYLHLTPQQVMRMADRGKLPGQKVGGVWRFSKAEVHAWLEQHIGASDEEELVAMENVLGHSTPSEPEPDVCIAEMLPREAIAVPLPARTRSSVIDSMVELAAQTGWLWDPARMAEAVRSREEMHSTALENGVALLHPRRPLPAILDRAFPGFGITGSGIPFGSGAADQRLLSDLLGGRSRAPADAGPPEPRADRVRLSRSAPLGPRCRSRAAIGRADRRRISRTYVSKDRTKNNFRIWVACRHDAQRRVGMFVSTRTCRPAASPRDGMPPGQDDTGRFFSFGPRRCVCQKNSPHTRGWRPSKDAEN